MAIVKRADKGSALTHAELDNNFTELSAAAAAALARSNHSGTQPASTISDSTTVGRAVLTAADAAAARAAIGAASVTGAGISVDAGNLLSLGSDAKPLLANPLTGPTLQNYRETLANTTTSGNITLTLTAPVERIVLDAIRQITAPADPGAVGASKTLILLCQSFTPTWSGVTWLTSDGNAPALNTTSGKRNVIVLVWDDNAAGTGAWLGMLGGKEV